MVLTTSYIENKFNLYNELYFGNSIKIKPNFVVSHAKTELGLFHYVFNKARTKIITCTIKISDYYDRNEKEYDNTIIHEMIHMYLTIKYKRNMGHGYEFKNECHRINQFGWNISRCTDVSTFKIAKQFMKKECAKPIHMAYFQEKNDSKTYFLFAICDKYLTYYQHRLWNNMYEDVHFFKTTNEEIIKLFSKCRNRIRGRRFITKEELLDYIQGK